MRISILFAAVLTLCNFCEAQTNTALISVDKITLHSDILEEERMIHVYLPDNYIYSDEKYVVLYVFDSPFNLTPVIGLIDHLESSYQYIPNIG